MSSTLDPYKLVGASLHDRYSLEAFVGLGRFSAVYRGSDTTTQRDIAIRVLGVRPTLPPTLRPVVLQHLRDFAPAVQEVAKACATFADVLEVGAVVNEAGYWIPAVVQALGGGERRSSICRTLQVVLAEERARRPAPRTVASAIDWMNPIADALTYAHASGVTHGNVAPQSIVVRREAPAQLLDLGMAAALAKLQARDRAFAPPGDAPLFFEPAYASPEHFVAARSAEKESPLGPASDVFSLALVMLELLTGQAPLGEGDDARMEAAALDPVNRPTPRARGRDLGGYVDTVFERALAVRPGDRHGTVESFWSALRAASRLTLRPSRPVIPPPLPLPSAIPTLAEAFTARTPRRSAPPASEIVAPSPSIAPPSGRAAPVPSARSSQPPDLGERAASTPPRSSAAPSPSRPPVPRPAVGDGADELVAGEVIAGKYSVERLLGRGGMGTVWLCLHLGLHERVAVKVMSRKMADKPDVRVRFEREARAAAKIKSRYVARVYDTGTLPDKRPYIVMEYMEGETLADAMKGGEAMALPDAVRILGQVGRGLARAHELGIVHRDVKPENVFLAHTADDGVLAKVFDFGIVKVPDAAIDVSTRVGMLVGTPHYMSPEQADGLTIDERSDIFSLGIVAFRMLTGKRLFHGESIMQILMQICTAPLPSLLEHAPSLAPEVDEWFRRTCARKREDRFDNVLECVEALALAAGVEVSRDVSILPPPPSAFTPSSGFTPNRTAIDVVNAASASAGVNPSDSGSGSGFVNHSDSEGPRDLSCPTLIDEDPVSLDEARHGGFESVPHLAGFGVVEGGVEPSSVPPTSLDGHPVAVAAKKSTGGLRFRRALVLSGCVAATAMCAVAFVQSLTSVVPEEETAAVVTPAVHAAAAAAPAPVAPAATAVGATPTDPASAVDAGVVRGIPPIPSPHVGRTRRAAAMPLR